MLGQAEEGTYNLREEPEDALVLCAVRQLSLPMRQDKAPTHNSPRPPVCSGSNRHLTMGQTILIQ